MTKNTGPSSHSIYLANSPTYANAFEQYGPNVPETVARRFVAEHGLTWDDMLAEGLKPNSRTGQIRLTDLFETLGY